MAQTEDLPPHTLGLWGDGDEIAAIRDVEQHFEVSLNYSDAGHWITAGDVFAALQRALPLDQAQASETWSISARAISAETGVDPTKVQPQTVLLGGTKRFSWQLSLLVAAVAGVIFALILHH